jgi:hypothetical protein
MHVSFLSRAGKCQQIQYSNMHAQGFSEKNVMQSMIWFYWPSLLCPDFHTCRQIDGNPMA